MWINFREGDWESINYDFLGGNGRGEKTETIMCGRRRKRKKREGMGSSGEQCNHTWVSNVNVPRVPIVDQKTNDRGSITSFLIKEKSCTVELEDGRRRVEAPGMSLLILQTFTLFQLCNYWRMYRNYGKSFLHSFHRLHPDSKNLLPALDSPSKEHGKVSGMHDKFCTNIDIFIPSNSNSNLSQISAYIHFHSPNGYQILSSLSINLKSSLRTPIITNPTSGQSTFYIYLMSICQTCSRIPSLRYSQFLLHSLNKHCENATKKTFVSEIKM